MDKAELLEFARKVQNGSLDNVIQALSDITYARHAYLRRVADSVKALNENSIETQKAEV